MYGSVVSDITQEENGIEDTVVRKRKRYMAASVPISFLMVGLAVVLLAFALHNNDETCSDYYVWFMTEAITLIVLATIDRICKFKFGYWRSTFLYVLWTFFLVWFSVGSEIFLDVDNKNVTCKRLHGLGFFLTILCVLAVVVYILRLASRISVTKSTEWNIDTTIAHVALKMCTTPRILILPFVFAKLGWISILLTIVISVWNLFVTTSLHDRMCSQQSSVHSYVVLLGIDHKNNSNNTHPQTHRYTEIVRSSLGHKSTIHVRVMQRLERVLICICIVWFLLEDIADMSLGWQLTSSWNGAIVASLLIFSTFNFEQDTLRVFGKVAMWSFVALLAMLYIESIRRIAVEERDEDVEPTEIVQKEPQTILCLAVLALLSCFPVHDDFWKYRESMRDPEDFSVVLYVASLFTLFVYVTFASTIYIALGDHASSDVVSSLDTQSGGNLVLFVLAVAMFSSFVCESRGFSDKSTVTTRVTMCVMCIAAAILCRVDVAVYLALIGVLCVLPLVMFYPFWIFLRGGG